MLRYAPLGLGFMTILFAHAAAAQGKPDTPPKSASMPSVELKITKQDGKAVCSPTELRLAANSNVTINIISQSDSPVMLIHLRPNVAVIKRAGQEDFNYGGLFAYSKICSHMGCPTSLYEDQTNRILCPCHQSQFQANEYARPVFGPAARPLAQLPIAVDDQGYLYARSDFIEPVGPGFWERRSS